MCADKEEDHRMKRILITGTSYGIGKATAELFLERGCEVFGIDCQEATIAHPDYHHFVADVACPESLP